MNLIIVIAVVVVVLWPKLRGMVPATGVASVLVSILDAVTLAVHRGVCDLLLAAIGAVYTYWGDAEASTQLAALRTQNDSWTFAAPVAEEAKQ